MRRPVSRDRRSALLVATLLWPVAALAQTPPSDPPLTPPAAAPPVAAPPAQTPPAAPTKPPVPAPQGEGEGRGSSATPAPPPQPAPTTAAAVGASFPEQLINRYLPYGLRITLNGYFRAPFRISWADRGAGRKPDEAQYNIRTPWLIDDDYFRSGFAYTRLQEQDWSEIYLGIGNKYLSATIALMGSLYSDWARPLIDRQWGIAQGWLTFRWENEGPRLKFRVAVKGGAFWDRWGYMPFYDTYLFGRTHQLGGQVKLEFASQRFSYWIQQGVGAHLEAIDANQGLTILNYVNAGFRFRGLFEMGAYFVDNLSQDRRQLKELSDASMRIYGVDARLRTLRFGQFYVAGSIITASQSTYLSPAIEVMHAYGGRGLTENYLGSDRSENGTGRLYSLGFEHRYSLADLLRRSGPTRLRRLHGGDVTLCWFGLASYTLSKQADLDPAINRNGRTAFKWGVEAGWSALSWLGITLRYDRVILDTNDDANSFRIITPRLSLRTHWLVDAEIYLQYSRYFYGERVRLRPGQVALETQPDTDVFKIQAQIAF